MADMNEELRKFGCPYGAHDLRCQAWLDGVKAGLAAETCAGCGQLSVIREVLDGDKLCQGCCDAWGKGEGQAEAEHREAEAEQQIVAPYGVKSDGTARSLEDCD